MATGTKVLNQQYAFVGLPPKQTDGSEMDVRGDGYGDTYVQSVVPTKHVLAEEGSYFKATTPTPGTGIAGNAVVTAFSDTNALLVIENNSQQNGQGKYIYLDYLRLLMSGTAPTATTVLHFAHKVGLTRRLAAVTPGTTLTPKAVNSGPGGGATRASVANPVCWANANAFTVAASQPVDRLLGRFSIPTSLGITGDEYVIQYGVVDHSSLPTLTAVRATAAARLMVGVEPIVIAPGETYVLHRWWLTEATNAPTFEFDLGWWER